MLSHIFYPYPNFLVYLRCNSKLRKICQKYTQRKVLLKDLN